MPLRELFHGNRAKSLELERYPGDDTNFLEGYAKAVTDLAELARIARGQADDDSGRLFAEE